MPALATLLLLGACAAAGRSDVTSGALQQPVRLRVLTYNIHHGEGTDGVFDLPRLAEVIQNQQPDLVALQEVDQGTTRAGGVDQAAELGRLIGMYHVFGKAMDYADGGYGEAILSRLPFFETRNHPLPHAPEHEPRAALAVLVELPGTDQQVWFVGTHLDHTRDPADRLSQAKEIADLFDDTGEIPVILAGDLNATPESDPMRVLFEQWSDTSSRRPQPTFPSSEPGRRIDYILVRPANAWRVLEVEVIAEEVASDHRPVLAVIEWIPPNRRRRLP